MPNYYLKVEFVKLLFVHFCFAADFQAKGPSIKDILGRGYKKCPKRRRSLVDWRTQGEGGYPKNLKFGETSFMDGP